MSNTFNILSSVIKNRRTVKPPQMNGKKIADEQITHLLELADWAPTHANTEPWKFIVYSNGKEFCRQHAALYQANTPAENFMQMTYDKLLHMGDNASHIIIALMQRKPLTRIPVLEEIAATSCAIQNLLLGATAAGIATYWGSGGMIHSAAMKKFLALGDEDIVMGALYLGYTDEIPAGKRNTPLIEKVKWVK